MGKKDTTIINKITMSQALKDHLENNPKIKHVYLNSKGNWLFHERGDYDKKVSREDILSTDFPEEGKPVDEDVIQTKTKPGKLVLKKGAKADAPDEDASDAEKTMAALIAAEQERDELKKKIAELEKAAASKSNAKIK